jgi:hypothetical protein
MRRWKLRGVELFHHPLHSLKSKGQLAADQVHEQGIRRVAEVVSRATGLWHGQDDVEARPWRSDFFVVLPPVPRRSRTCGESDSNADRQMLEHGVLEFLVDPRPIAIEMKDARKLVTRLQKEAWIAPESTLLVLSNGLQSCASGE